MSDIPKVISECTSLRDVILPPAPAGARPDIGHALDHPAGPTGFPRAADVVRPGESVCIVVSDHTRATATDVVLPILLRTWTDRGCATDAMSILFASGIHRPPRPEEVRRILGGAVADTFGGRIFFHTPDHDADLVPVGVTRRGHRVRVHRRALEADRLILTGAATYHYHAGFGGGRKSLVPGLAARDTIAHNHSLTLDPVEDRIRPGVEIGRLDGNPVAEEMLEGARFCEPDWIINTVLAPTGELAGVFAGELDAAHRAACRRVEETARFDLRERADIVVAFAGTALNWVQSHKALYHASRAVRAGGRIVLVASCPEGLGDERFRFWFRQTVPEIYRGLRRAPEVLGQTALSTRTRAPQTILVTRLSATDIRDLGIRTAPDLETAVRMAVDETRTPGARPSCHFMPEARHVVPFDA